jgi:hypothetical protein
MKEMCMGDGNKQEEVPKDSEKEVAVQLAEEFEVDGLAETSEVG